MQRTVTRLDAFKAELIDLCRKHGVSLHTSGYDWIEAWGLGGDDSEDFRAISEMEWHYSVDDKE